MAVHAAHTKKKSVKWKTFDSFLRRINFILIFFQEELASLLSAGKPFFGNLEGWKFKIFPSAWTMVRSHWDTDFSELIKLCPLKRFFLVSTPGGKVWEHSPNYSNILKSL